MLTPMTEAPAAENELESEVLAVNTKKAAAMLGVSRRYLYELIASGEITTSQLPSTRSGKPYQHQIEVSELKAFLRRHRTTAA